MTVRVPYVPEMAGKNSRRRRREETRNDEGWRFEESGSCLKLTGDAAFGGQE